jgi:hypothetical protein
VLHILNLTKRWSELSKHDLFVWILCEIKSYDLEIIEALMVSRTGYDIIDKTLLSMQTKCNFRNLKYSYAASFTTASVLVVLIIIITIQSNQYSRGQIAGGNVSTSLESVNVNLNETGDKILHRGIAVSEKFDHPYLNDTHRVIILPFREDERTYAGILNFRASTPVEVILGQRVPVDSATLSMVEKEFGDLEAGNITHGTVEALAAGVVLKPQYGDSPQYYSASSLL